MSLITISTDTVTAAVIRGTITRPLVGVWWADLVIDQPGGTGFDAGTKVTIKSPGYSDLVGVVAPGRSGDFVDAVHVRILGGAGGMAKDVQPRSYVQPQAFVRDVLNGLCGDNGETLSTTVDAGFLGTNLAAWSVKGEPASFSLRTMLDIVQPSFNWRILADGTLWMGTETWATASVAYEFLHFDPQEAVYTLGLESPAIDPGTTIDGVGKVSRVEIEIAQSSIRAKVWVPTDIDDRGANSDLTALINQKIAHVDYYAMYACQVASQSSDLTTVDINPVGARNRALLGSMQRVPVFSGAGVKIQFAPGATVLLGWDGGNPEGPYVVPGPASDTAIGWSVTNATKDGVAVGPSSVKANVGGATWMNAGPTSMTLGTNPAATPVLTVGSVDSMGCPVTNSPTNTGTVLAG